MICDPASGSGGFLIRFFEIVRRANPGRCRPRSTRHSRRSWKTKKLSEAKKAEAAPGEVRRDPGNSRPASKRGSRLWKLANRCIYGTDANDRMARTSKMNMIMHGDGHGGVHHHDGFLNVNGIFEGRFDIILTNPPFGANVEPSDVVHESDVAVNRETRNATPKITATLHRMRMARVRAAEGQAHRQPFRAARRGETRARSRPKSCSSSAALPCSNPAGGWASSCPKASSTIRRSPMCGSSAKTAPSSAPWSACRRRPSYSSGASVKASLLFLQKFTEKEQADFDAKHAKASAEVKANTLPMPLRRKPRGLRRHSGGQGSAGHRESGRHCKRNWPTTKADGRDHR